LFPLQLNLKSVRVGEDMLRRSTMNQLVHIMRWVIHTGCRLPGPRRTPTARRIAPVTGRASTAKETPTARRTPTKGRIPTIGVTHTRAVKNIRLAVGLFDRPTQAPIAPIVSTLWASWPRLASHSLSLPIVEVVTRKR
jgi:hypothetical protein